MPTPRTAAPWAVRAVLALATLALALSLGLGAAHADDAVATPVPLDAPTAAFTATSLDQGSSDGVLAFSGTRVASEPVTVTLTPRGAGAPRTSVAEPGNEGWRVSFAGLESGRYDVTATSDGAALTGTSAVARPLDLAEQAGIDGRELVATTADLGAQGGTATFADSGGAALCAQQPLAVSGGVLVARCTLDADIVEKVRLSSGSLSVRATLSLPPAVSAPSAARTYTFTRPTTPFAITAPGAGFRTAPGPLEVAGTAPAGQTVSVRGSGGQTCQARVPEGGSAWSCSLTLPAGPVTIVASLGATQTLTVSGVAVGGGDGAPDPTATTVPAPNEGGPTASPQPSGRPSGSAATRAPRPSATVPTSAPGSGDDPVIADDPVPQLGGLGRGLAQNSPAGTSLRSLSLVLAPEGLPLPLVLATIFTLLVAIPLALIVRLHPPGLFARPGRHARSLLSWRASGRTLGRAEKSRIAAAMIVLVTLIVMVSSLPGVEGAGAVLRMFAAVAVSVVAVNLAVGPATVAMTRQLGVDRPRLVLWPEGLLIALLFMLGSLIAGLLPPLAFAQVLALRYPASDPRLPQVQSGRFGIRLVQSLIATALGFFSWALYTLTPNTDGASLAFANEVLVTTTVLGFTSALVAILPVGSFLVAEHSPRGLLTPRGIGWIATTFVATFATVAAVVSITNANASTIVLTFILAAAGCALGVVALWLYRRYSRLFASSTEPERPLHPVELERMGE